MKTLWNSISNIGIGEYEISGKENRRIRLLNRFVLVICFAVIFAFIFQFIEYQIIKNEFNINSYLMLLHLPLAFVFSMHRRKKYIAARVFFVTYSLILTTLAIIAIGQLGVDGMLIIFPVVIVMLFDDLKTQLALIFLTILMFASTVITSNYIPPILKENTKDSSIYMVFTFQAFLTFILLLFYKNEINIAEEKLRQKNEDLEQFSRAASHDLKEPAKTIAGFASLIQRKHKSELPDEVSKYLGFINDSSVRMVKLLNDLLTYATTGTSNKKMSKVDLNVVLKESIENLDAQISASDTIINVNHLPTIKGHKSHLIQLFQNVISNGIKYQPKNQQPKIKITTQKESGYHIITIQDNGIGIEKKYLDSVFNSFTRLHSSNEYEGSGIGLATCKKIVDIHQGKIEIDSEPGVGTKMSLFFEID